MPMCVTEIVSRYSSVTIFSCDRNAHRLGERCGCRWSAKHASGISVIVSRKKQLPAKGKSNWQPKVIGVARSSPFLGL